MDIQNAVFHSAVKKPMMNNKGQIVWAIYIGEQFIDVFEDAISAEKRCKTINGDRNKPKLDNTFPKNNTKTSISFL